MEPTVEKIEILAEQLRSPDEETRRLAVVGLAAYPLAEVKASYWIALGDVSWRVRKEAVDALLTGYVDNESMETLVSMLAAHDNAGLRNSAVEALERLGGHAIPILSRHINDKDHDVRKFVIDILGSVGDYAAVPLLIQALDDTDPNVSAAAAENLGKIADTQAVPHLIQALAKNDLWLRYTIIEALRKIAKPVPIAVIAPLINENFLKKTVFDCIGVIGGADTIPLLLEGFKEKVKNAREAAIAALVKVRERLPADHAEQLVDIRLKELAGSPFVDGLLSSLETPDRDLQEAIVVILGIIGDERAVVSLVRGCCDERLRKHCLQALQNMGDNGVAALFEAFPAMDDEERCYVAYVCGELRDGGCAAILRDGMHGASSRLRRVSVLAAGKSGQAELIDEITFLLEDRDHEVREGAIAALAKLAEQGREVVSRVATELASANVSEKRRLAATLFAALGDDEKLFLLIKDEDAMVRKAAVAALAGLKSYSCVSQLVMALADEDVDVRIAVAGALGEIGGDNVLGPLLLALKDEDLWVKCAALKALGRLHNEKALPAIVEILENAEGLQLISALETVAEIGGKEVLEVIKKGLDNSDEEVVKAAIGILARKGGVWIDEYEEKLLFHNHWDVRRSFIKAIAEQRGEKAMPLLKIAYAAESDSLVKETIAEIMGRFQ
jgi:HEAT repeat protein